MKKITLIFGALLVLMLASCGNQPNDKGEYVIKKPGTDQELRIKFFDNGNIDYIQEVKNDQPEGFFVNFHKNGNMHNTSRIVDGKKQGTGVIFWPDGSVKSHGVYKDDVQQGFFWLYDTKNNLVEKREYVNVGGKNMMNQWIQLDENLQPVFKESNFISLQAEKDTIRMGEEYVLKVVLEASFNQEYMALIVGPFDETYQAGSGTFDTIVGQNFVATYKTKEYKKGLNTIRGVVKDLSYDMQQESSKIRNIYFSRDFYVSK